MSFDTIYMPKTTAPKATTKTAAKTEGEFLELADHGTVKINDRTSIKVRTMQTPNGDIVLDVRQYITSKNYTGFAKGVMIPPEKVEAFQKIIAAAKASNPAKIKGKK